MTGPLLGPPCEGEPMTRLGIEPRTYGLKVPGSIQTNADTLAQSSAPNAQLVTEARPKTCGRRARWGHFRGHPIEPATPSIYTDAGARAEALTPLVRRGFGGAAPSIGGRSRAVNGLRTATGLLSLLLLAGCEDATGRWMRTPEGRQACASKGGTVFDAPMGDKARTRCYRMIRIDTTRAVVEDTTGGGR